MPFGLPGGAEAFSAMAAALRDPLAVLEGRSPGARANTALFQTKADLPADTAVPFEQVLPTMRLRDQLPPQAAAGLPNVLGPLPGPDNIAGLAGPPDIGPPVAGQLTPLVDQVVPPAIGTPIIGAPIPGITPPTVSAVPEPATWIEMIIGIGLVGARLRSRRRVVRPAVAR